MRLLVLFFAFVGCCAASAENCQTYIKSDRGYYWFFDWEVESIKVTVKDLIIQGVDDSTHLIETAPQNLDLRKMSSNGVLFNLVDTLPAPGDSMQVAWIQTNIQTVPQPRITLKSGDTCRIALEGGGTEFPEKYCGPPGSYRINPPHWIPSFELKRDFQKIFAEDGASRYFDKWVETKTEFKECCPDNVSWGNSRCIKTEREVSRENVCPLRFQCTTLIEVIGG